MGLCDLCSSIEKVTIDHDTRKCESRWYTVYTHEAAKHEEASSLETSVQQGCTLCGQFYASLTEQHRDIMLSSKFAGIIVALFWDRKAGRYTKLQYILGPEFDSYHEAVTDTFEIVPLHPGMSLPASSA